VKIHAHPRFGRTSRLLRKFPMNLGLAPTSAAIGVVSVGGWPCGQDSQPNPRRYAPRGERRGLLVLTAGPVPDSYGVTPPARWPRLYPMNARGSSPLFLRAAPIEGRKGQEAMTRTADNQAARRRGEGARDRGSRMFDRAIYARRRLSTPQPNRSRTRDPHDPNPSYAYLGQSHD
jgi:hypothetical protein